MKLSEKLVRRLRHYINLPPGTTAVRVQFGIARSAAGLAGAWKWELLDGNGRELQIGSWCTMRECVEAEKIEVSQDRKGDWHVDIL